MSIKPVAEKTYPCKACNKPALPASAFFVDNLNRRRLTCEDCSRRRVARAKIATKLCKQCSVIKVANSFDRSPATGKRYKLCRLCRAENRHRKLLGKEYRTLDETRAKLWKDNYPIWQAGGHTEATGIITGHDCGADIVTTRLVYDSSEKHNQLLMYCNRCLTTWRTGVYSEQNVSVEYFMAAADAIYGGGDGE